MRWEDPPPGAGRAFGRPPPKYSREADELRANKGRWALLEEHLPGTAAYRLADNIRRGNLVSFRPAGSFEVRAQNGSLWACYKGDDQDGN